MSGLPMSEPGGYRRKILILYFSGAGATKKIAGLMREQLLQACAVDIFPIDAGAGFDINDYDALIIGTPVCHAAPPRFVTDYFEGAAPPAKTLPTLIYSTMGLCSLNTNRILAKQLRHKNIITIMDTAYRSPASDGSLIAPRVRKFFEFEPGLERRVAKDCAAFVGLLQAGSYQGYIPRFRPGSIINAPNKLAGQLFRQGIHLHRERCRQCGRCVAGCPMGALSRDSSGGPVFEKVWCINCYRCIHHCPVMALSLTKRSPPGRVLTY